MNQSVIDSIISQIFSIKSEEDFNAISLEIFHYQYNNNPVYRSYCDAIKLDIKAVKTPTDIPFLPIQFFKSKPVLSGEIETSHCTKFMSSGTTATGRSEHFVIDLSVYESSFTKCFEQFYGKIQDVVILALLPSYQEQGNSSLVYMVDHLVKETKDARSGFYLNNDDLIPVLEELNTQNKKVLLIGVTYALLDLIETRTFNLTNTLIMETGGMKGRRQELTKSALHKILYEGFGVAEIHSEYGMTELLSQGYSAGDEWFSFPNWMRCYLRPVNDPLGIMEQSDKTGGVNIIDLANIHSCSFIATQDLGRMEGKKLKIMGRFDVSDTRGCNLMVD